jgi:hypothetical protein
MRSLLRFLGAASSALFAILLAGTLLTSTGRADEDPETLLVQSCTNCCGCSQANPTCIKNAVGNCPTLNCANCGCSANSGGNYLCYRPQ